MTKKSFEDELMYGMQRELRGHDKNQGMNNLVKAAEYLHSAMDILEEAGLSKSADQVLRILGKIVIANKKEEDSSKADDNESAGKKDKDFYEKVMKWIENPATPVDPENPQPGEEIEMQSILQPKAPETFEFTSLMPSKELPPGEDLTFKSIAQELGLLDNNDAGESKPRKPKDPTKVHDGHVQGLTSEKMVKNLENHGTVFNMADDGFADDLLNVEINDEPIEVMDPGPGKTFEDSD